MATGLADKASGRDRKVEREIEGALRDGRSRWAMHRAILAVQSETKKVERHRPHDAPLIEAELAALLVGIAAQLYRYKPVRPPGCQAPPSPGDLLTVFSEKLAGARGPAESGTR